MIVLVMSPLLAFILISGFGLLLAIFGAWRASIDAQKSEEIRRIEAKAKMACLHLGYEKCPHFKFEASHAYPQSLFHGVCYRNPCYMDARE